ncbi:Metallo-hydrolase/oxidoreductase [Hesseltinella vesiculosa]|uniref:Metallo-hydrolase/oxidoreductase n=1 Tax=Hesseltinella vesiculosa TaxID=101127 RepID=A0A1X2GE28_9FUNG|nr:Metallo-hydrolase/oxidoreductase [Hesseltinella vesiculosa]
MASPFQPPASNSKSYSLTLKGNQHYEKQQYNEAIQEYTKSMEHATTADFLALLYSNRSSCYLLAHQLMLALMDAEKVIQLAPDWPKVKVELEQYDDAIQLYRRALEMDNRDMGFHIQQLEVGRDLAVQKPSFANPVQRQVFDFAKQMRNIIYLVADIESKQCVIVDACWDIDGICQALEDRGYTIVACVVTHSHIDHVGHDTFPIKVNGLASLLKRYPHIKAYIHAEDIPSVRQTNPSIPINRLVASCTEITTQLHLGKRTHLRFIHTPGHTPGSQSILVNDCRLIAGDTLLCGGLCGRTDLAGGDRRQLENTLRHTLGQLDDRIVVYPGHNYGVDWSTIAIEREKGCLGEDLVGFGMSPTSNDLEERPTSRKSKRASVSSMISTFSIDKKRPLSVQHPTPLPMNSHTLR